MKGIKTVSCRRLSPQRRCNDLAKKIVVTVLLTSKTVLGFKFNCYGIVKYAFQFNSIQAEDEGKCFTLT